MSQEEPVPGEWTPETDGSEWSPGPDTWSIDKPRIRAAVREMLAALG
ncbi:MAG: hypothetical protein QOD63_2118, partial [Actinomycetota bacterium]|nr:hypothetical protein [Actinomycetota bacterium]